MPCKARSGLGISFKRPGDPLRNSNRGVLFLIYIFKQPLCLSKQHQHPSNCLCEKPQPSLAHQFPSLSQSTNLVSLTSKRYAKHLNFFHLCETTFIYLGCCNAALDTVHWRTYQTFKKAVGHLKLKIRLLVTWDNARKHLTQHLASKMFLIHIIFFQMSIFLVLFDMMKRSRDLE